ncbi:MAG: transketolase [Elusimicrobia bacterium]|nr:transketolase [Elusimicrobiota bacterium]
MLNPDPRPALQPADLRRHVLHMAYRGQAVHIACAFSLIEILAVLYSRFLRFNPLDPGDPGRDYLVLSKGHGAMALYACLRELNWLTQEHLDSYFSDGSELRGLAEAGTPGIEATSGSLGHGLPVAVGIALGLKRRDTRQRVYCIVGDGELNEGSMWEAFAFAAHHGLDNLTVVVDANQWQALGRTKDILDMEPLLDKFRAFKLAAAECGGHDTKALETTLEDLISRAAGQPQVLVARTVKGKGVSFMEGDNQWHYTQLTEQTLARALAELAR